MALSGYIVPKMIIDMDTMRCYERLLVLGVGATAQCFSIRTLDTDEIMVAKVVDKTKVKHVTSMRKIAHEIALHKIMCHPNIVKFFTYFEDSFFTYIILEYCENQSLHTLIKNRKSLTEFEVRHFMHQIILGIKYLHDNRIMHRDLKLGNIFLGENFSVKIGDFGLAARLQYTDELRGCMCGTPNYVAPEILMKKHYTMSIDIWSLGCIMYTLLTGTPPFHSNDKNITYQKILTADYTLPSSITSSAATMVKAMLQVDSDARPKISELLNFEFILNIPLPKQLPHYCSIVPPESELYLIFGKETRFNEIVKMSLDELDKTIENEYYVCLKKNFLQIVIDQISLVVNDSALILNDNDKSMRTTPGLHPKYWITKFIDYTGKYGLFYRFNDQSICALFRDGVKYRLLPNGKDMKLISSSGRLYNCTLEQCICSERKRVQIFQLLLTHLAKKSGDKSKKSAAEATAAEATAATAATATTTAAAPAAAPAEVLAPVTAVAPAEILAPATAVAPAAAAPPLKPAAAQTLEKVTQPKEIIKSIVVRQIKAGLEAAAEISHPMSLKAGAIRKRAPVPRKIAVKAANSFDDCVPHVFYWFHTSTSLIMILSNGNCQIHFYNQMSLLLSPSNETFTVITRENLETYKFKHIREDGCPKIIYDNLRHARDKMTLLSNSIETLEVSKI